MARSLSVLMLIILLSACRKQQVNTPDDYLIFGKSYGMCAGDCAHFYLVKGGQLYKDKIDRFYRTGDILFDETPQPKTNWEAARSLINNLPSYLVEHADSTFGCPDCADQGAVYIEYATEGKTMYWHIDPSENNQPPAIKTYIAQLEKTYIELQEH